jgi:uncharacterized integral membrane protein
MCWTPPCTRRRQTKHYMVMFNIYCVMFYVLFVFVLCMVVSNTSCVMFYVFCLPSCVWWCPTHLLLCFMFYLSHNTICVEHHHTQDEDKQNIKHNTICVEHHHTQDEEKQNIKHNTICVEHVVFVLVLCMVMFNTYCVMFYVLFVFD